MFSLKMSSLIFALALSLGSNEAAALEPLEPTEKNEETEDHWAQFRGPGARGVLEDDRLPIRWGKTENVTWVSDVPGRGWSSPVVWGDKIFLTSVTSSVDHGEPKTGLYSGGRQDVPQGTHRWKVFAFSFDSGELLWEHTVHEGLPGEARHLKNSYASETPVVDAERLYVYFGNLGVYVFDHDGKERWTKTQETVTTRNGWGTAASPALHDGRLFLVNDNEDDSYLLALDSRSGEPLWRVERDEKSNWATPFVWQNEVRTEIVCPGSNKIRSYSLDGKLLWEIGGMSTITIPTPFAVDDILYVASGYLRDTLRPVYAVRAGAVGDLTPKESEATSPHLVWWEPQAGPYNPSPIVYRGAYYTLFDRGFFTSHRADTGKQIYGKHRVEPTGGNFTSSPWAYNGYIFCLSEDGVTYVVAAGDEFNVIGENSLDEVTLATPAIYRGSLLIRTASKLYRIAKQ